MIKSLLSLIVLSLSFNAIAEKKSMSLDELLKEVRSEQRTQSVENTQREKEFAAKKAQQNQLLAKAKSDLRAQEAITTKLTKKFESNEKLLSKVEEELNIAMGTLGELFGVVRQIAGDLKGQFQSSVVSAQIPGREKFVGRLAETKVLPGIKDLEGLWFEMQREMTESGKVAQFKHDVVMPNGDKENKTVTRVGSFNLVSDGNYLNRQTETGQVIELPRQPSSRFTGLISDLESGDDKFNEFAIDPSRGSILSMLVQAPSLFERIQQGGIVGYVILTLLIIGLIIVGERMWFLRKETQNVNRQLQSDTISTDNSLGRVMKAYEDNKGYDLETLELKMDEAILKNTPPLERGIGTVKILYAVSPLLGLLGTVTGMIATFQSITLFGTGDPKLMAGGISQALITTVLGLVAAIPLLLLHNVIATKSRRLVQILEEQCAGLIADREEKEKKA